MTSINESVATTEPRNEAVIAQIAHVHSAARWFWWIAGLSLVNTVLYQTGSDMHFIIGLALKSVCDALFENLRIVGIALDLVIIGFFVLMGYLAIQLKSWPFYLGLVIYVIDGLIYVLVQEWLSVAFHAFVVFCLVKGIINLRQVLRNA